MVSTVMLVDLVARLFGLLRSLINPKVLGAAEYGRLGLLSAYLLFAAFGDLGLTREFEILLPVLTNDTPGRKTAVQRLLRKLIPRVTVVGLLISALVTYQFGSAIGLACLPYVVAFGFAEIYLVQARTDGRYLIINFYTLGSAILLTAGTVWVAPNYGILGIAWLQSLILVLGAAALFWRLRKPSRHEKRSIPYEGTPPSPGSESTLPVLEPTPQETQLGAHWLLLGQLLPLLWMTADRFYLAGRITAEELGSWTLGSLPGSVLIGLLNTLGGIRIPHWIRKSRPFVTHPEAAIFFLGGLMGLFAYSPFVRHFLPLYQKGIHWNLGWMVTQGGLALLFYYDAHRRAQVRTALDSRDWFTRKFLASVLAIVFVGVCELAFRQNVVDFPRPWVPIFAFHFFLITLWLWEQVYRLVFLQMILLAISILLSQGVILNF